jgi:cell division protein FtsI/penicillin-binding protein 2
MNGGSENANVHDIYTQPSTFNYTRMRKRKRRNLEPTSIPMKANVVLNVILAALILIAVRIWHLNVIEYEEKLEDSKKSQRKSVVEPAKRATIRDRFNLPLAINKTAYRASITYSSFKQVPNMSFETDSSGKKVKRNKRKEYIEELSELLGRELDLDPKRVEDLIYSKAALYYNIPYILKEELTEKEYYRLLMMEKDLPGLTVQRYAKREYPKGKSASDIIGYMGAISRPAFEMNIRELKALESYLTHWENGEDPPLPGGYDSPLEVRKRYKDLKEFAYTSQDYVGKAGIEAIFEERLRGFQGKKHYYSDSKGNFLKELPGARAPIPGKRILLTISQELQEYAESLLAQNETIRMAKSQGHGRKIKNQKQPWIKGGAIVALDPKTGEVLALASYPRFDPNDFILSQGSETSKQKKERIHQWFEDEAAIADLWNQKRPLERERFDVHSGTFYDERQWLTWENYLNFLLPKDHPIIQWFAAHGTLQEVIDLLNSEDEEKLSHLPTPYTKLLFLDCCRLAVLHTAFSKELLAYVGNQKIGAYKDVCSAFAVLQEHIKPMAKTLFHDHVFLKWRENNEKEFLKGKREEEKELKTYPKPYLDYFDEKENSLFQKFWDKVRLDLCLAFLQGDTSSNPFTAYFSQLHQEAASGAHPDAPWQTSYHKLEDAVKGLPPPLAKEYLAALRSYEELNRPLQGKYRGLRSGKNAPLEKHLAAAFYPAYGFGYGRSQCYRQSSTQGSIFKLITAYAALTQLNEEELMQGKSLKYTNPLDMTDDNFKRDGKIFVGYATNGKPIPQLYKGGRVPRSASSHLGKLDLLRAIETSSNPYFSILAGDVLKSPEDLADLAKVFGYGCKTGIDLPGEIPGKIPDDLSKNRTGLYATAIGQHSLVVTPLQSALFLASIANSGDLLKPLIVKALIGVDPDREEEWLKINAQSEEQKLLYALGIDFRLFDPGRTMQKKNFIESPSRTVRSHIEMPPSLRNFLLEGMRRVVLRTQAESLIPLSRLYVEHPEAISDYVDLKNQLIGKTSTSESMERIDFDEEEGTNLYTHLWFGGISFERDVTPTFENPELVVVVYLRYGGFGKEAAPLAAQVVKKWREIKAKMQAS